MSSGIEGVHGQIPADPQTANGPERDVQCFLEPLMGPSRLVLLEVRFRRAPGGMGQLFFPADAIAQASRVILGLGERTDVYFGVAPRLIASGRRGTLGTCSALWVDCDTAESCDRLSRLKSVPSIIVRSGSEHGRHAYWLLDTPLDVATAECLNRRLALALGADGRSADAARILRPPGTRNFKHDPPAAVTLEHLDTGARYRAAVFDAELPRLPAPEPVLRPRTTSRTDPLRSVPPATYVRVLLGIDVGRTRKITCPFHDDRTPSLHVYPTAEEGWYCFGCGRGTSIYDMAAAAWGMGTRGDEFIALRQRLRKVFRCEGG